MNKKKIAISIDNSILNLVDSYIDDSTIRSRSQAIEFLIKKSLKEQPVDEAVLLIHPLRVNSLLTKFNNSTLLEEHVKFLVSNNIKKLFIVSKISKEIKRFSEGIKGIKIIFIDQEDLDGASGTALAVKTVSKLLKNNFVVMNGDTYNKFDLKGMIRKHIDSEKTATIGLISSSEPHKFGSVVLNGSLIINFLEKGKTDSNIINAGIYIFNRKIFDYFNRKTLSLERDLFPLLAKKNELNGFFTYGGYYHLG